MSFRNVLKTEDKLSKEKIMPENGSSCGCPCHKAMGGLVIAFGLVFLLRALGVLSDHIAGIVWPVIIILAGLNKMTAGMCKCCDFKK